MLVQAIFALGRELLNVSKSVISQYVELHRQKLDAFPHYPIGD